MARSWNTMLLDKHYIPGAIVGIVDHGYVQIWPFGVTSRSTNVEVTEDTLFQIGSITKTFTGTLVMQLVDEGALELDTQLGRYLPELRFVNARDAEQVTVRQLLNHTSGIEGDQFIDCGRGDDCLKRYATLLPEFGQFSSPGTLFSYCNTGFMLLGRLIEVATGMMWDSALMERLCLPLKLVDTVTLAEEAILRRTAVGHLPGTTGPVPTKRWSLPRSLGPTGLISSNARDLLTYAQTYIEALNGNSTILTRRAAEEMFSSKVALPLSSLCEHWGLSWMVWDARDEWVFGHDGSTIGQFACLRVVPQRKFAVVVLTNGPGGTEFAQHVVDSYIDGLPQIDDIAQKEKSRTNRVNDNNFTGFYKRRAGIAEVREVSGELYLRMTHTPPSLLGCEDDEFPLRRIAPSAFAIPAPERASEDPVQFVSGDESDGTSLMYIANRAYRKVS